MGPCYASGAQEDLGIQGPKKTWEFLKSQELEMGVSRGTTTILQLREKGQGGPWLLSFGSSHLSGQALGRIHKH